MTDTNTLVLIGRITKDVTDKDFGYTSGGLAKLNTSIAVNISTKKNGQWSDEASFFDITLWGKTAENLKQYLGKGQQVAISGHLQQQRWKDQNGNNQQRVAIVTDNIQLLGSNKNNGGQTQNATNQQTPASQQEFPEDIPF